MQNILGQIQQQMLKTKLTWRFSKPWLSGAGLLGSTGVPISCSINEMLLKSAQIGFFFPPQGLVTSLQVSLTAYSVCTQRRACLSVVSLPDFFL